ncbi:hypothetical protein CAPTEDRAFT_119621, partial [Capitella teleta]
ADYIENIHSRRVIPEVQPGYLREMLPNKAPRNEDAWKDVMKDVERPGMPGVSRLFPCCNSACGVLCSKMSQQIITSITVW